MSVSVKAGFSCGGDRASPWTWLVVSRGRGGAGSLLGGADDTTRARRLARRSYMDMRCNVGHSGIYRTGGVMGNHALLARTGRLAIVVLLPGRLRDARDRMRRRHGTSRLHPGHACGGMECRRREGGDGGHGDQATTGDVTRHADRGDVAGRGGDAAHRSCRGRACAPCPCLPLPPRASIRIGRGLHVMVENLKDAPATGNYDPGDAAVRARRADGPVGPGAALLRGAHRFGGVTGVPGQATRR